MPSQSSEMLVTFFGNHDDVRFIGEESSSLAELKAAFSLLWTMRGIPQTRSRLIARNNFRFARHLGVKTMPILGLARRSLIRIADQHQIGS
jgi:hypothetical protein